MLETQLAIPLTRYRLRAVLRYTNRHFLTYALMPDETATLHWAKFDDLKGLVEWEDPTVSEQSGNTFDFMLFYERMAADEKPATTGEGEGVTRPGDAATKAIDISSGEEDSDEEDSDEEDYDTEEEVYEELPADFGHEVEYDGLPDALAAEYASEYESLDDGSVMSSEDEDFDDDLVMPDFGDLTLEAQAQEISIVFQQATEPEVITEDVRETLLANSKQVLIVGSMLAEALQKQAQGDNFESSGRSSTSSDDEMRDQSADDLPAIDPPSKHSEHMLRVFRNMPAYKKGVCLAQGTQEASDLLEDDQHHHGLLRKLHLYTGRAIMMCKELHEADSAPEDHSSALFKAIPTLRGRDMGLRLGSYYRSVAIFLSKQPEPEPFDICNAYLCSSYATEMGWKLDDLQVTQNDRDSKVRDLEDRNKALEAQVAELQVQLQDLKVTKPAVKPDMSTMSAADFFEHMQHMQSVMQSVVQESRRFILPDQGADQAKLDEMEVDQPVTSIIPGHGPDAPHKKQDVVMSEDLLDPPVTSGLPVSGQDVSQEDPHEDLSGISPKEGGVTQPKLGTGKLKSNQKTTTSPKEAPPPTKPLGSPTKGLPKQSKGGLPNFMSTTAAAAAKSRPAASKSDTKPDVAPITRAPIRVDYRPKTRAATRAETRAGVSAEGQASARPETPPVRQPATSLAAPETREEVHTGGRRRLGHRGDVSPVSPSDTPTKKVRGKGGKK